jgi:hypothetical protein
MDTDRMVPHTFLRPFMEFFPTQFLPLAHAAGRATARPPGGRLAAWRAIWVGAFPGGRPVLLIVVVTLAFGGGSARAADEAAGAGGAQPAAARFFIQEYRVEGAKLLPRPEVEAAVYPFLGPGCTEDDIEKARAALEKAYHAQGWLTVLVQVPNQDPTAIAQTGVVVLKVTETPVGRLRVRGAQYFPPSQITAMAPSLAEGRVPNYNDVQHDIVALNQLTDLRVTPELLPVGYRPDTVDVNLDAKDSSPLHGSLELNNRESPGAAPHRRGERLQSLAAGTFGRFQLSGLAGGLEPGEGVFRLLSHAAVWRRRARPHAPRDQAGQQCVDLGRGRRGRPGRHGWAPRALHPAGQSRILPLGHAGL